MLKVLLLTDHGGCNQMLLKGPSERLQLHNHCPILISILLLIEVKHVATVILPIRCYIW